MSTAYPADAVRDASFAATSATTSRGDADGAYRAARRHSRYVRALRVIVLAGIAVVLLGVIAANYMPAVGPIRLPGELGKLVIKGTKITMQAPKLTGYTSDSRPYEFTADTAAQDINKPDLVELQHMHARLEMADKSTVEMTAPSGLYDMKADKLVLYEDIALASSTGYAARLQEAVVDMHSGNVISDKPVAVKLLNGFLNAKRMTISENGNVIHFDGGVSMVLHPDQDADKAKTQ
ncbi:MAG TPA: LPS export ABC transporter periplasmic protein LptC [Xanthobacteraceae bacterium]|nr:LPS export ABC transporter periplasmic protein LptC [Xanthobacteraceae bacterium]